MLASASELSERSLHRILPILAATAGTAIANIYYNQPLIESIRRSFPNHASWAGAVPAGTQIDFATRMLLLAPLGDRLDRHRLITWQAGGAGIALLIAAWSPTLWALIGASFLLGVFATLAQQSRPFRRRARF